MVARTSNTSEWTKWRDRPRDSSRSDETKRRAELWQAFCDYVHAGRGWITSSAGGRTAILRLIAYLPPH